MLRNAFIGAILIGIFHLEREKETTLNDIEDIGMLSYGRRSGLMVRTLDSGSSGLGSSPGRGHRAVFLGKLLNSHSASLRPGVKMGTGGNPAMD